MNVDRHSYFKQSEESLTLSLFGFGSYFNIVKATDFMSAHIFARYSRILANKNRFLVKYKTAHIGNPHGNQSQKLAVCEPLHLIIKCQTYINQKLKHLALIRPNIRERITRTNFKVKGIYHFCFRGG